MLFSSITVEHGLKGLGAILLTLKALVSVCLILSLSLSPSQAYADYMGFVRTLNEGVKGKSFTCDYNVSEVCRRSHRGRRRDDVLGSRVAVLRRRLPVASLFFEAVSLGKPSVDFTGAADLIQNNLMFILVKLV